jgi:hypothetical protein
MKKLMMLLMMIAIAIITSSSIERTKITNKEDIMQANNYLVYNPEIFCWYWICACPNENCGVCGGSYCRYQKNVGGCYSSDPFNYVESCAHDGQHMIKRKVKCPVPNGCN